MLLSRNASVGIAAAVIATVLAGWTLTREARSSPTPLAIEIEKSVDKHDTWSTLTVSELPDQATGIAFQMADDQGNEWVGVIKDVDQATEVSHRVSRTGISTSSANFFDNNIDCKLTMRWDVNGQFTGVTKQ